MVAQNAPVILSLTSAVGGALVAGIANTFIEMRRRRREMISLANAFYGEIVALLSKVEHRGYVKQLRNAAKKNEFVLIDAKQKYFSVYQKNCINLGKLPPALAAEIAKFYIYAKAFIDDTDTYCSKRRKDLKPSEHYIAMAELLEHIGVIGQSVMTQVETLNKKERVKLKKNKTIVPAEEEVKV